VYQFIGGRLSGSGEIDGTFTAWPIANTFLPSMGQEPEVEVKIASIKGYVAYK
jgi:hypothetical protein